jgi:hypothetical protein
VYDTGWKRALIDLTPYAGQTLQLAFSNHNRVDNKYNTWSYVDNIQVQAWPFSYRTYVSRLSGGAGGPAGVPATAEEAPSVEMPAARGAPHTGSEYGESSVSPMPTTEPDEVASDPSAPAPER